MFGQVFILTFIFGNSLAIQPSDGCGKTLPDSPKPGEHYRFFFEHNDVLLGAIERDFIVQIPKDFDNTSPIPLLFDVHWYAGSAPKQVNYSPWTEVALRENLIIVWPNGMNDTKSGSGSGSWNVSSTFGSKGPICDLNRGNWPPPNECFESCPLCDESYSCDWTTCYDDIGFLEVVIETVKDQWCVDLDQMHMSGISNGGMLLWNIAAQVPDGFGFATFNTIAASPQLGFALPTFANWQQFSFIDMHGLEDITIPTNLNSAYGPSPYDGLMSKHGSYFEDKEKYLKKWSDAMKCSEEEIFYETPYDGQNDFYCLERKCPEQGNAIVRCFGNWGHEYPLAEDKKYVAAEVAFKFMMDHPKINS